MELADRVASEKLDIESWRSLSQSASTLYGEIRTIKGMGEYAAGNLLRLLGHYQYLALDSWVRSRFYDLHTRGTRVSDRHIEQQYREYGEWRGLIFWLEMTQHWHDEKFSALQPTGRRTR